MGHTPFGHAGEDVLNELYGHGFRHNEQSLRIVDFLENDGRGLNLTWEVRDGILNHSKTEAAEILGKDWGEVNTLEGEVCKLADIVAYINHDIGDAIRAGIITERGLPLAAGQVLGITHSQRINTMVCDIIESSWAVRCDIIKDKPAIKMSPSVMAAANTLREFLFERVYNLRSTQEETAKARGVVRSLYSYFNEHRDLLPAEYRLHSEDPERMVVDYIAGMTDQYALRLADRLIKTA